MLSDRWLQSCPHAQRIWLRMSPEPWPDGFREFSYCRAWLRVGYVEGSSGQWELPKLIGWPHSRLGPHWASKSKVGGKSCGGSLQGRDSEPTVPPHTPPLPHQPSIPAEPSIAIAARRRRKPPPKVLLVWSLPSEHPHSHCPG